MYDFPEIYKIPCQNAKKPHHVNNTLFGNLQSDWLRVVNRRWYSKIALRHSFCYCVIFAFLLNCLRLLFDYVISVLVKALKQVKIGNFACNNMKNLSILLSVVAAIACLGLSGCGGGSHAQVPYPVEEQKQPIAFICDHASGMALARQEKKPALIFFSVPDNLGSQRMMDTTFSDDEIKRLVEKLVCIHVDGSQETLLCETFGISSFPTIILFNASGMEVRRLVGRQTPDQLAIQIHVLLQATALRSQTTGR